MCWHHFCHYGILTSSILSCSSLLGGPAPNLKSLCSHWLLSMPQYLKQPLSQFSTHNMFLSRDHTLHQKNLSFIIIILFNASIPTNSHCSYFQHNMFLSTDHTLHQKNVINNHNPVQCFYSYKQPLYQLSTQCDYINFCYIEKDVISHNHMQYSFPRQISEAAIVPIFNTIW